MVEFSLRSIAIKWHFFWYQSGVNVFSEYFNLFMKQLGFNPAQIGLTTLMGFSSLLIPLCVICGEKFRARKTVLVILALGLSLCCMLPLLSLIVPALQPKCYSQTSTNLSNAKQQALSRKPPVPLSYANNTRNLKRSTAGNGIHLSRGNAPYFRRKSRASNGSIRTNHARKRPSDSNLEYFLNYSTTSIYVSRHTSLHPVYSKNPTRSSTIHHPQPWLSALFIILILSRSPLVVLDSTDIALTNVATMTYLGDENASYGAYYMWGNVGTALSICLGAGLAWIVRIPICGVEKYGYFVAFALGFLMTLLSMLSLPWFKFEYNEKKNFNWSAVKSEIFKAHYIFMFAVLFYTGLCLSFQIHWEFWYLDGLFASPLLFAGAIVIRRPLVAASTLASSYLIRKIGDLKTICLGLLLYSLSFLALSFTRIAWLVLLIDSFQAVANGISYCAFTVLFYKASSKETTSIILGKYQHICTTK